MQKDLLKIIQSEMGNFSKGQRVIADYILNHYDKAAFMTAQKLGATVGISESTVVRFASQIGLDGYPQLQRELQDIIRNKLTSVQRIEVMNDKIGDKDVLNSVLNQDIEKIKKTLEGMERETFENAVASIVGARRVYILGVRSSAALANFLSFYLNLIFPDVRLINTTSTSEMFEQIMRIGCDDVIIGISFPRYSKRTYQALRYASDCGAKVIAITDSSQAPIAQIADTALLAKSDMASFVDSLVAPLSLINALIVAVGIKKKNEISETFDKLEHIWEEYEVYEKQTEALSDAK